MKIPLAISILLPVSVLAAQQATPNPPATASIEGTLTDAVTGTQIRDMVVTAHGPGNPAPARSSDKGAYRIAGLGTGAYHILVSPDHGYISARRYIHIQSGQDLTAIDLKLQKEAIIAGRVLGSDKNPVSGARVTVRGLAYLRGRPMMGSQSYDLTNDLGEYRISRLNPGAYYLEVDLRRIEIHKRKPLAGKETQERPPVMANIRTYYPNAISADGASLITLRAGEVREGVDVTLLKEKTICVTSAAVDPIANDLQVPTIMLSETYAGSQSLIASGSIKSGDEFEICGVGPGLYRLSAYIPPPDGQDEGLRYASIAFSPGNREVNLPPLNLQPSFSLSGKVGVAGANPEDSLPTGIRFSLEPKDRILYRGEKASAQEDSNGTFTFPALTADPYWLDVFTVPSGYYVKAATLGASDALSVPIQAASGARLEVVLGSDSSSVSGQVNDRENQPIADATVVLAANPPRSARTDQDGKFTLSGIIPGDYRVAAFTGLQDGLAEDPNFIQAHFGKATELTLSPGASISTNLTAQPVD